MNSSLQRDIQERLKLVSMRHQVIVNSQDSLSHLQPLFPPEKKVMCSVPADASNFGIFLGGTQIELRRSFPPSLSLPRGSSIPSDSKMPSSVSAPPAASVIKRLQN